MKKQKSNREVPSLEWLCAKHLEKSGAYKILLRYAPNSQHRAVLDIIRQKNFIFVEHFYVKKLEQMVAEICSISSVGPDFHIKVGEESCGELYTIILEDTITTQSQLKKWYKGSPLRPAVIDCRFYPEQNNVEICLEKNEI